MADFKHRPHKRRRLNSPQRVEDDEIIPPPFKWATNRPATVHTLNYLRDNNIRFICGEVQCKKCNARYKIHHNLQRKFSEIRSFIIENVESFNQRAPTVWMNPKLPDCKECKKVDSMKPVISPEKSSINWLFLLLGNLLGCCTLEQLKYFCKHTQQHRTGAKDRVLFAVYVTLCKQLEPEGSFVVPTY
ncbi:hypothetical protein AAC387_Pa09g2020 [Persea americana]